jgi:hypothetical protein
MLCVALCALASCAREEGGTTPEDAAGVFLEAIERSQRDPDALRQAFDVLDTESRRRLEERARSATGAREYAPWEMIVSGRTALRFIPQRGSGLRARPGANPDEAVVVVTGEGEGQYAELSMRREEDGWRVVLAVPEMSTRARASERE